MLILFLWCCFFRFSAASLVLFSESEFLVEFFCRSIVTAMLGELITHRPVKASFPPPSFYCSLCVAGSGRFGTLGRVGLAGFGGGWGKWHGSGGLNNFQLNCRRDPGGEAHV